MKEKFEELSSSYAKTDFGRINLSYGEKEFYRKLNNEIVLLCKSLPDSIQTDASLFFMKYSGTTIGQDLDFFKNYYVPAWSIVYWIVQSDHRGKPLPKSDIKNGITVHSMAMFLHSLDDHLSDGQMPVTHLALLLRSQSWLIMNAALNHLTHGVKGGKQFAQRFIQDYYSSVCSSDDFASLDSYCDLFRKQMAIGLIVPVLLATKKSGDEEFVRAIQTAYGSFGIAWRLLDDIQDVETDMMRCAHSAIYVCLPDEIRHHWDKDTEDKKKGLAKIISDYVIENKIIDRIKKRIGKELEAAAFIANGCKMSGLADEFYSLLRPLR
jgi:hypothetical protein